MFFVVWSFSNSMEDFTVLVYLLYHILGLMFASKEFLFIYLSKKKTKNSLPCLYHTVYDKSNL